VSVSLGCIGDGFIRVEGRVVNKKGKPVDGALVSLSRDADISVRAAKTTDKGEYRIETSYAPSVWAVRFRLLVEHAGYKEYSEVLEGGSAPYKNHTVILESDAPSGANGRAPGKDGEKGGRRGEAETGSGSRLR
jgi:hypothetical protein